MAFLYLFFFIFFFSSRRRHTMSPGDWSSDVCSSDLGAAVFQVSFSSDGAHLVTAGQDGRSEERRVGKSVDLGGRRIIKKKKKDKKDRKKNKETDLQRNEKNNKSYRKK